MRFAWYVFNLSCLSAINTSRNRFRSSSVLVGSFRSRQFSRFTSSTVWSSLELLLVPDEINCKRFIQIQNQNSWTKRRIWCTCVQCNLCIHSIPKMLLNLIESFFETQFEAFVIKCQVNVLV